MTSTVPLRRVGASGLLVSAVGLGCNNFGREGTNTETLEGTRAVLDAAIDAGVTFLDTADMYGSEPGSVRDAHGRGAPRPARSGHAGDEVRASRPRHGLPAVGCEGLAVVRAARGRGIPHPSADRLDRPVPAAHARPATRRSKRPSTCSPTWCARARSATSATRTSPAGRSPRRTTSRSSAHGVPFVSAQNHYSLLARARGARGAAARSSGSASASSRTSRSTTDC